MRKKSNENLEPIYDPITLDKIYSNIEKAESQSFDGTDENISKKHKSVQQFKTIKNLN